MDLTNASVIVTGGRREVRHGRRGGRGVSCVGGDRCDASRSVAMTEHAVVIAGGGPTGLMLAGGLA